MSTALGATSQRSTRRQGRGFSLPGRGGTSRSKRDSGDDEIQPDVDGQPSTSPRRPMGVPGTPKYRYGAGMLALRVIADTPFVRRAGCFPFSLLSLSLHSRVDPPPSPSTAMVDTASVCVYHRTTIVCVVGVCMGHVTDFVGGVATIPNLLT